MNIQPLISIITVSYNAAATIEQTILSVLNQTYKNIEYIIIDGGSTDGTVDIIKKYSDRLSYWVSEPDKGIYDAMNKGIDKATGELIGIINSDDWYELDCVENVLKEYSISKETVIYGLMRIYNKNTPIKIYSVYPICVPNTMIPHPTCFIPKSIYKKYGTYNINYKSSSDYELIIRLKKSNVKFFLIEKILTNFREGGYSHNIGCIIESLKMRHKNKIISRWEVCLKIIILHILNLINKNLVKFVQ